MGRTVVFRKIGIVLKTIIFLPKNRIVISVFTSEKVLAYFSEIISVKNDTFGVQNYGRTLCHYWSYDNYEDQEYIKQKKFQ